MSTTTSNAAPASAGIGYAPATMELYHDIIELRQAEQRANRS
jgi:hypothetical protein